ncbi:Molybdopterin molybdenumtransferase [Dyadobacter sp. CECT 9275]|uniref:Molybdopterin molybdenumtransferase n=1 Tax=Dyadobacter helix TaxID=2822344 RepID=A0A916ND74_9BACT|nr:gephyrin-like molybdotransferase Glp [Dyadobacter sp. CECT 9275]CAG5006376.1 Molybdopterin molybdenumtransferase [Dyadobacter sp. CECT 9275]
MITVTSAREKVVSGTSALPSRIRHLSGALGYVLARDVIAPVPLPSFRQSSMDGYALNHLDITGSAMTLPVSGESKAGETQFQLLAPGTAFRIFTGAPVPEGATAVVMQERATRNGDKVTIHEFPVVANRNLRNVGQQINKGEVALPAGTLLGPGAIGFLGGFGITEVEVHEKPKVVILITGDELVTAGQPLKHGQIYESNAAMLIAALEKEGIAGVSVVSTEDSHQAIADRLGEISEGADLIIASGGISVGDYDFVGKAMMETGVATVFYKVKQKPGKPLFFGQKDEKLFFALPGNPASSLVCFYEYVLPALRKMYGRKDIFLPAYFLPSTKSYSFDGERDEFLKAHVEAGKVTPLFGQESFALRSFALANALIYLPADQARVAEGDLVEVHLLP